MCLLKQNNADSGTDRNISLTANQWNLIGHSAEDPFYLEDATFTDSSGTTTTRANTVSQNKVYGYLAYWDSTPTLAQNRKYKYSAQSGLGMDDANLQPNIGYWFWPKQAGTLTLPDVGGTVNTTTYAWNKLRFSNGTDELNVTDADSEGWIDNQLRYSYNPFKLLCPTGRGSICNKEVLSPWEGYFIWSEYDNITLIRQN